MMLHFRQHCCDDEKVLWIQTNRYRRRQNYDFRNGLAVFGLDLPLGFSAYFGQAGECISGQMGIKKKKLLSVMFPLMNNYEDCAAHLNHYFVNVWCNFPITVCSLILAAWTAEVKKREPQSFVPNRCGDWLI